MTKHRGDFEVCRTLFGRNFGLSRTVTTTSASTLTLNNFSTAYQIFEGSTAGQVLNLGDATTYFKDGQTYFVLNDSSEDIVIENNGGTQLFELKPNFGVLAVLEDGSTADGSWRFFLFLDNTLSFVADSASPGFSFGRSGNNSTNTWMLRVGGPPSNKSGITVGLTDAEIKKITVSCEDISTFDIGIYSHDGDEVNLTLETTVSIVAARSASFTVAIPIALNKQLAARVTAGSARNLGVDLTLTGSSA